jgi:dephospho-CoA kinase
LNGEQLFRSDQSFDSQEVYEKIFSGIAALKDLSKIVAELMLHR